MIFHRSREESRSTPVLNLVFSMVGIDRGMLAVEVAGQ